MDDHFSITSQQNASRQKAHHIHYKSQSRNRSSTICLPSSFILYKQLTSNDGRVYNTLSISLFFLFLIIQIHLVYRSYGWKVQTSIINFVFKEFQFYNSSLFSCLYYKCFHWRTKIIQHNRCLTLWYRGWYFKMLYLENNGLTATFLICCFVLFGFNLIATFAPKSMLL